MVLTNGRAISLTRKRYDNIPSGDKFDPLVVIKKPTNRRIVNASNVSRILFKAKGNWFFDMFRDELIIEEKRIIIKRRYFPFFTHIVSLPVQRITVFEVTHSLFFSEVHIKGSYGDGWDATFQWLSHKAAQRAKEIVDGLRLRESESIEIASDGDLSNFVRTIEKIGGVYN